MFSLVRSGFVVEASGFVKRLPAADARGVETAVRAFFASQSATDAAPALVVGALPFRPDAAPFLYQPESAQYGVNLGHATLANGCVPDAEWTVSQVSECPSGPDYANAVRQALARMADRSAGPLDKVVLARSLELSVEGVINPDILLKRMAIDPIVSAFQLDMEGFSGIAGHSFVGATPELLVARKGLSVRSHPLAGSAARHADKAADDAAAQELLSSEKDIREHGYVVQAIMDTLAPLCSELSAPEGVALLATQTMWHLGTRIEGTLKSADMPSAAGLAALLHPTPAVGGYPQAPALDLIRAVETHDRGFYAGAVGWVDGSGDGEWYVALRCADIQPNRVVLNAGAGIVLGSDPDAEMRETGAKFGAMLQAFGA